MAILKVENLHKKFGALEVLKGVSFQMEKGDVIGIIGSSGGGKSTLLRLLTFLERAEQGFIEIGGDVLVDGSSGTAVYPSNEELKKLALKVGLVFQSFNLFPHLSVKDNLTIAPILNKIYDKSTAEKKATELLSKVGLSEKINAYPCELSGGQQQRVAIARALMMDPQILCFDEPTSALDPELTGEVLKVIKGLKADNTTMIVVTHEIMFARDACDKIIFLDEGEVVEYSDAKSLVDNPQNPRTQKFINSVLKG